MDVFTFEDAGGQSGLAVSNPHSATNMTGPDVAASSTSLTCAEPEVLEHRPPEGMLVLHCGIFRDSTLQGCH